MAHPEPLQMLALAAVLVTLGCNNPNSVDRNSTPGDATGGTTASPVAGSSTVGGSTAQASAGNGGTSNGGNSLDAIGGSSQTSSALVTPIGQWGEYVDADGRCRAAQVPMTSCPATFEEAQALSSPCGSACSGICGGVVVSIQICTPTRGCAYDVATGANIGSMFFDDVRIYCNSTTAQVIAGGWPLAPAGCTLSPARAGDSCPVGFVP